MQYAHYAVQGDGQPACTSLSRNPVLCAQQLRRAKAHLWSCTGRQAQPLYLAAPSNCAVKQDMQVALYCGRQVVGAAAHRGGQWRGRLLGSTSRHKPTRRASTNKSPDIYTPTVASRMRCCRPAHLYTGTRASSFSW